MRPRKISSSLSFGLTLAVVVVGYAVESASAVEKRTAITPPRRLAINEETTQPVKSANDVASKPDASKQAVIKPPASTTDDEIRLTGLRCPIAESCDCDDFSCASCTSAACGPASNSCASGGCDVGGYCESASCATGGCSKKKCKKEHHLLSIFQTDGCCDPCLCCGDPCRGRSWVRFELLTWWMSGNDLPALVTTSPANTPQPLAGVLGAPGTSVLYGGDEVSDGVRNGGRIRFGHWFDDCWRFGIAGSFWALGHNDSSFQASSDGVPILARPFGNLDPLVFGEDAELVAYPGLLAGSINVETDSELYSGDMMMQGIVCCKQDVCCNINFRLGLMGGYRFLRMNESVGIYEALESTALTGPVALGTTFDIYDSFEVRNEFHGGQFGLSWEFQKSFFTLQVLTSFAVGNLVREVTIDGGTVTTIPNAFATARSGGLLTQATNIGVYEDSAFSVLTEVQANLGCQLTRRLRSYIGYNFTSLAKVVRAGDQIDRFVNGTQLDPLLPLVGAPRPQPTFDDSKLWLSGINAGLEITF